MNPWQVNQSRSWTYRLRRWWADMMQNVRQSLVGVQVTLRRMAKALVRALNLSWIRGLRHRFWALRAWLFWVGHSIADWAGNARDLPFALRVMVLRTSATIQFVRSHKGLRRFVLGLPALATGVAFVAGLSLAHQLDRSAFQARYRREAQQALRDRQWDAARVYYLRLAGENGDRPELLYNLAESLEGLGQTDRAEEIFDRLSPESATGYAPAHVRKAKALLAKTPTPNEDKARALAHLMRAVSAQPDSDEANALLGEVYLSLDDFSTAKKYLLRAEPKRPELSVLLAGACGQLGDWPEAERWAKRAADLFERRVDADPSDVPSRLRLAEAMVIARRYPEATAVIRQGLARTDHPSLRQLGAIAYLAWYNALKAEPRATEERQRRLKEGLEIAPDSPLLLQLVVEAARGQGTESQAAADAIKQRLNDPKAAAAMHSCLANDAHKRGDTLTALRETEAAFALAPSPETANNLAWLLAISPKPDLPRALEVVTSALKTEPNNPNFRDTRGQILVKLKRPQEAVTDLEYALTRIRPSREIHLALAQAYRALGLNGMADNQEQKAKDFDPSR